MTRRRFRIPRRLDALPARRLSAEGLRAVERIGFSGAGWGDAYHAMMTMPVSLLLAVLGGAYLVSNLGFALLYLVFGDGIANARPGSFVDAFFFSVQTMATIGYGNMYPRGVPANLIVTAESVYALLSLALTTGIFFSRFSRPTARVLFSRIAVVTPHNGVPTLMFRVANRRRNQILEALMSVTVLRSETSLEGVTMRRFHDLRLVRSRSVVFALTWTVMHPIDAASPLHGLDAAALAAEDIEIVCSMTGIDDTFNQQIHARYIYGPENIRWNARFADILGRHPEGNQYIDYTRFHETAA